ncbi:TPA: phage baseplate protein [Providencia alcalifaciens]|uniref:Dit-like phage tail protein N-terminal domain-containing protein n=2 Tax=Providencia alcalifaciens TaxID=126385 RepID=A0AAV3M3L7_9GAMM|nr:hypothetical protein [Providencia alcalifaciens]EUD10109.1 hypothetical protein HMPREF1563_2901 [Providencia alcalifaciens 205/92]MTC26844.1 hypothetical protein [Providencia alcalifaciens]MTC36958.1 hypothetical protein [Providencia alcalifaciens]MTC62852.1 hypothetical protein [Providencia alcalifaciens]WGZ52713.1 hypothetical protein PO864_10510 [Providencia alcalifaciens]
MDLTSGVFTGRASVITRAIGDFELDCTVREEHTSSLRMTKNPIESGADIADHAILEPKVLTITGIVVGYEPPRHFKKLMGIDNRVLDEYPLPIEVSGGTHQALAMIEQYISSAVLMNDRVTKVLAPWYPKTNVGATDGSQTRDRVGRAYESLLSIQKSGETIDVQTGIRLYKNMMITNIGISQDKPGAVEITLTLEEIFIVESQTAQGLHPDLRGQPKKKNMGRTQPISQESHSSLLKDGVSMMKDIIGSK